MTLSLIIYHFKVSYIHIMYAQKYKLTKIKSYGALCKHKICKILWDTFTLCAPLTALCTLVNVPPRNQCLYSRWLNPAALLTVKFCGITLMYITQNILPCQFPSTVKCRLETRCCESLCVCVCVYKHPLADVCIF